MADYFVASGGSNTSPYDTWAKAATSLATALAAATATGDRVIIQYNAVPSGDAEVAADTTYTLGGHIAIIAASNDGGSAFTPTAMGASNWIGNSTTNRSITWAGAFKAYFFGITLRTSGSTSDAILIAATSAAHQEWEDCYFWMGNTGVSSYLAIGNGSADGRSFVRLINPTLRFGDTDGGIRNRKCRTFIEGGSVSTAGSAPVTLFESDSSGGYTIDVEGSDLSHVTGTLMAANSSGPMTLWLRNCKLGSGVTVLASGANKAGNIAWLFDCSAGDEHYHLAYHDHFGSLTVDTGIYANDGAQYDGTNRCSWKIVTTANCSYFTPFVSPRFDVYHSGTSAVTPSIEFLRDGSTTAYQDDEVWGEWAYKGTAGSTRSTLVNDRKALTASAANQAAGVGTSGWTGENASAWSGKLQPASTITPAEIGHIRGRVCVGEPSITVYLDPQTRLA